MDIIFDAGGVLLTWNPHDIASRVYHDPDKFVRDIIRGDAWKEYDAGRCDREELLRMVEEGTDIPKEVVYEFIELAVKELHPIEDTFTLIDDLIKAGHRLYLLSNMPKEMAQFLENRDSFWDKFTGRVFSGYIRMAKPDHEIFSYITNTYNLIPEKTIFIDDYVENIEAARDLGFMTHLFSDAHTCRKELSAMEVLP